MKTNAKHVPERRQNERFPLAVKAEVSLGEGDIEAQIYDLSPSGAKLRLKKGLLKSIVLSIPPFGVFEGEVAWTDEEFVGIKFNEDHKAIVNLILQHVAGTAP
jgi:hypothetical protein